MLLVNKIVVKEVKILIDKYHSPLLSIVDKEKDQLNFDNPQVILDNLRVNVYIEQTGQFETKQMNGCAKNTKTKNAIFSLNRRCFPSIHIKIKHPFV